LNTFREQINQIKYRIFEINNKVGEGHILSSLSCLNLIYEITSFQIARSLDSIGYDKYPWQDKFVLSKGHAALGFYAVLENFGLIKTNQLETFGSIGSKFGGHPDANKLNFAYVSTGSLGHGLPISVGAAWAKKIKKENGEVYCLCGDGEILEGTTWESMITAGNLRLDNLTLFIDYNSSHNSQSPTKETLRSFALNSGWNAVEIDGHNNDEIRRIMNTKKNTPLLVISNTILGGEVAYVQGKKEWHRKQVTDSDLLNVAKELGFSK
jgi:transketolase